MNGYKSFFEGRFLRRLQRLILLLQIEDVKLSRAGVRAQALGPDGELIEDFKIEKGINAIHILNVSSPAATVLQAIGEMVSQIAVEHLNLLHGGKTGWLMHEKLIYL